MCDLQIKNKKSEMINVLYLLQRPKVLYETNNKIKDQTAGVVSMTVTML